MSSNRTPYFYPEEEPGMEPGVRFWLGQTRATGHGLGRVFSLARGTQSWERTA